MDPRPVVIALPGFTRAPRHLARLAAACEGAGWECIRPMLAPRWLPVLYLLPSRLHRLAMRLAPRCADRPVVVAGHSAGGAAGTRLASELRTAGVQVAGLVLIDAVDSPNHLIARSLPSLAEVRVAAVLAPPSPCNRQAALERSLAHMPAVRTEVVPGAGHGDIEGAGIGVYRRACKDSSDAAAAERFLVRVIAAIAWVLGDGGEHEAGSTDELGPRLHFKSGDGLIE
ncbi:MAG: thioesterase domain-containing protein [Actinomycetales bacterium]